MIRFATQPAEPLADRQVRVQKPAAASPSDAPSERAAGAMLIPDLVDAGGETAAKSGKARGGRKQKAKSTVEEVSVQLDLNA